ncbi:MAG: right-handed parallel beta-helix repeat-containing protein, partial [Planctomycetaceae bacterium]
FMDVAKRCGIRILDGKPVPEHRPKAVGDERPAVPAGHWIVWKGSIYYRAAAGENPRKQAFRYAARSVGVTLYEARDVQVLDLTIRFFRLDGVNAHDRSLRVKVENVKSLANGRSGIAVGGSSAVVVRNCEIKDNRRHSVLLTELGAAKVEDSTLSRPPTVPDD